MFGVILTFSKEVFNPFLKGKTNIVTNALPKPSLTIDKDKVYIANLHTNYGVMTILLYAASAPENVNNFIYLSNKNYYSNLKFHRLIPDLLLQGGDPYTSKPDISNYGKGNTGYLIKDEVNWDNIGLSDSQKNKLTVAGYSSTNNLKSYGLDKYTIAMANNGPNTNSSQFFIVLADYSDSRIKELNGFFTVIGKVINGTDVLDQINKIPVNDPKSNNPLPTKDIIIQKIEINNL